MAYSIPLDGMGREISLKAKEIHELIKLENYGQGLQMANFPYILQRARLHFLQLHRASPARENTVAERMDLDVTSLKNFHEF